MAGRVPRGHCPWWSVMLPGLPVLALSSRTALLTACTMFALTQLAAGRIPVEFRSVYATMGNAGHRSFICANLSPGSGLPSATLPYD